MRWLLVLVLALALPLAGCSFLFVDGPSSSRPATVYPSCDEERTIPAIDLVIAGLYGVGGLVSTTSGENEFDDNERTQALTSVLLGVALFGASSWYGFSKTSSCRVERTRYRQQFGDPRLAPPMQPVPYAVPSGEGQQCHPQAGCQPGLACASGLCVRFEQPLPAEQPDAPPPRPEPPPPPPPSGTQPWPPPATP